MRCRLCRRSGSWHGLRHDQPDRGTTPSAWRPDSSGFQAKQQQEPDGDCDGRSTQFLPINVNLAPSLFSVGSNDGKVTQGNVSSANANAQNENQSFQANGVVQAAKPVKGTPGSPCENSWGRELGEKRRFPRMRVRATLEPSARWPARLPVSRARETPASHKPHPTDPRVSRVRGHRDPGRGLEAELQQGNSIGQQASASSQSTQILPINANVAPVRSSASNPNDEQRGRRATCRAPTPTPRNDDQWFQGERRRADHSGRPRVTSGTRVPGRSGPGPQGRPSSTQSLYAGQQHRAAGQRFVKEHADPADQRQRGALALQRRLQRWQREAGQRVERQRQRHERQPVVPGQWRRADHRRPVG